MKNRYSSHIGSTPQTHKPIGRSDMEKNNAGGYSFKITAQEQLERFLMLGAEGGTYYAGEQKLTIENATSIVEYIKSNGSKVVATILDVVNNNRAPKMDPILFVLTLAMTYGNDETKKLAYQAIPIVCKTSTHLFTLVGDIQKLRGWSRGLRKAIAQFYLSRSPEKLAYQLTKYRQRNGFTHRDILRLAHVKTNNKEINNLLSYAVGKTPASEIDNKLVQLFDKATTTESVKTLVEVIKTGKLTWEMVPTEHLNQPSVLEALLENMPLVALLRNLNRYASAGLTDTNGTITKAIVAKLTNKELIKTTGLHPVNVVNAMLTYSRGQGFRGSSTWTPNQNIVDALDTMFYTTLEYLEPTKKNILIGVDNSGSMNHQISNTAMTASQFANVLALSILRSEPNAEVIAFNNKKETWPLGRRSSLTEALNQRLIGGSTDCAVPIVSALASGTKYDAIIILTDNESWAGQQHGFQALQYYRQKINKDVKIIEIASVSTPYSTFPSDDKNLLRIVGFDASVLELIGLYLK